ncbi:MAG: fibronectin type III-like domain-contianing protein [Verrucomicrobiota bacterium]
MRLSFILKNTGSVAGAEVAQVYVSDRQCTLPHPAQELKSFQMVSLQSGETRRIEIPLGSEAFRFWHPEKKRWVVEPGQFEIHVGSSSRDIRLRGDVNF